MHITNQQSGTNISEIAEDIYRINTPVVLEGGAGGFSFNQFLILDDALLLFHTGPRRMFPLVREAVASSIGDRPRFSVNRGRAEEPSPRNNRDQTPEFRCEHAAF